MKKKQTILTAPFRNLSTSRFFFFVSEDDSEVAKTLSKTDWLSDISYIDLDSSDDKLLSFIEGKKIMELVELHGFNTEAYRAAIKDKSLRQSARAGKVAKRLLPHLEFTPQQIETFTNKVIAQKGGKFGFEIIKGDRIKWAYLGSNYHGTSGMLHDSCMRHERCQDYFDIYTENDEAVNMLVLLSPTRKVMGRALVWTNTILNYESDGGKATFRGTMMDRIYTVKDADVERFRTYAKDAGWALRSNRDAGEAGTFDIPLENGYKTFYNVEATAVLDILSDEFDNYPYMDTLQYLDGDILSNQNGAFTLTDTDGQYSEYYND